METKFEIGDRVRHEYAPGDEATIESLHMDGRIPAAMARFDKEPERAVMVHRKNLTLVRRASAQREGGFIPKKGDRVRVTRGKDGRPGLYRMELGAEFVVDRIRTGSNPAVYSVDGDWVEPSDLEPVDPAPAQLGCHHCEPPQPSTMTRAARVLAGMEQDPYEQARNKVEARIGLDTQNHLDHYTATATDNEPKQQAARLRMAKMSLDRPLDAERARWERLALAKVPVGRR